MESGNRCPLHTFSGLLLRLRRKDDSGLFFKFCFTYKLLGFLGRDTEDIKKTKQNTNYSSSKLVLMNTSETVTYEEI